MTSFRLRLRAPYRSVRPNDTFINLQLGCHKGWSFWKTTRWREIHASVLNYSRISWNGGYHSLLIVSVLTLIYNILQPNLDPEDSNVPFETKALHFFVLFTYRQVTKSNWVNLIDFGQNVLKTTKSLFWYQHTAVFLTYYHGMYL